MKAHGGRWEGEREEARLFPRPIVPRALCIFFIIAILLGYPAGASEENRVSDTTINA